MEIIAPRLDGLGYGALVELRFSNDALRIDL